MQRRLRVWDLPTRLFHWSLAACVAGAVVSVNIGGNAVGWHFRFGYAILALLLFRLVWGFAGPRYARFASFPPSPAAALRHLRAPPTGSAAPGHNPLGALSVYAMLLALAVQVGTGLFANDAIMWDGPLKNLVSNAASDALTRVHKINRFVVIALVLLHVGAIAFHRLVRGHRLVAAMVHGDALIDPAGGAAMPEAARDDTALRLRALLVLAVSVALVWALVSLAGKAGSGF